MKELYFCQTNIRAFRWSIAPWDWSGILLARVIHEGAFFALVTDSEAQQRIVLEQFIDEVRGIECGV